jgi:hypothetical protein
MDIKDWSPLAFSHEKIVSKTTLCAPILEKIKQIDIQNMFHQTLPVWTSDTSATKGSKMFYGFGYDKFYTYYNNINKNDRCCYEMIQQNIPTKLYLDLDMKHHEIDINDVVKSICETVSLLLKTYYKQEHIELLQFDSSNKLKQSRHLIFQILFKTQKNVESFIHLIKDDICDEYKEYIDTSVYSKNRNFRLYGSSKKGQNRFLKRMDENGNFIDENIIDKNSFYKSLIQCYTIDLNSNKSILQVKLENILSCDHEFTNKKTLEYVKNTSKKRKLNSDESDNVKITDLGWNKNEISDFSNKIIDYLSEKHPNSAIHCGSSFFNGCLQYTINPGIYCPLKGDVHKNNSTCFQVKIPYKEDISKIAYVAANYRCMDVQDCNNQTFDVFNFKKYLFPEYVSDKQCLFFNIEEVARIFEEMDKK